MSRNIYNFYGIKFYNWSFKKIINKLNQKGGYLVAPAASSLSKIFINPHYHQSLKNSSIAIYDSGFFCILLRIFNFINIKKFSGYLFLNFFINNKFLKKKKILTIDPSKIDEKLNKQLLAKSGFQNIFTYVAPNYNLNDNKSLKDQKLLSLIKKIKPHYVIINIGGEKQEILAEYITNNVSYKVVILCTGAAIAFITKRQAPINRLIDKIYLGWLIRLIYNPIVYFKRVLSSLVLIKFFLFKLEK